MNTAFLLAVIVISVVALAPIFYRLLGSDKDSTQTKKRKHAEDALAAAQAAGVITAAEYQSKLAALPMVDNSASSTPASIILAASIAIVLPISALLIYRVVGEPQALNPNFANVAANNQASIASALDMATALQKLESKLELNPDDVEAWQLLAHGYRSIQKFDKALVASRKVRELLADDLDAEVEYIEALALSTPGRNFSGEPQQLLNAALVRNPDHQRALWLAGIAASQRGDNATALRYWRKLAALLPPDNPALAALQEQITILETQPESTQGLVSETTENATTPTNPNASNTDITSNAITVVVDIAPGLKTQVSASDTLFVFARAAQGPKIPLAIQRLTARQLPITVILDDSMSMMPNMKLSSFANIVLGARLSKSGDALANSGDLQVVSAAMNRKSIQAQVPLIINEVVP